MKKILHLIGRGLIIIVGSVVMLGVIYFLGFFIIYAAILFIPFVIIGWLLEKFTSENTEACSHMHIYENSQTSESIHTKMKKGISSML